MKRNTTQKLVFLASLLMTNLVCTSVTQASDISIYRAAQTTRAVWEVRIAQVSVDLSEFVVG